MKSPVTKRQARELNKKSFEQAVCSAFALNTSILTSDDAGIYVNPRIRDFYSFCEGRFMSSQEDIILDEEKDSSLHLLMVNNNMKLNRKFVLRKEGIVEVVG